MSVTSLRQFARMVGVSDTAVRKAERAGVFGAAVRRDAAGVPGIVDLSEAVAAWERSGRQLRGTKGSAKVEEPEDTPLLPPAPAIDDAAAGDGVLSADVDAADAELVPPPGAPASPSLVEAQRRAMLERHRRLKLDNDLKEGLLVEADRASREAFEFSRVLREAVLNVPSRIAAELAAVSDASRVHVLLEQALRQALETTAATMETRTDAA